MHTLNRSRGYHGRQILGTLPGGPFESDACPEPKAQADPLTREHSPMAEPEKRSSNLLFSSI